MSSLAHNATLTELGFGEVTLKGAAGMRSAADALAEALRTNCTLRSLDLSHTALDVESVDTILDAVGGHCGPPPPAGGDGDGVGARPGVPGFPRVEELMFGLLSGANWNREGTLRSLRCAAARLRRLELPMCEVNDRGAERAGAEPVCPVSLPLA